MSFTQHSGGQATLSGSWTTELKGSRTALNQVGVAFQVQSAGGVVANQHGANRVGILDTNQATQQYFARIHRAALVLCGNPWDADDLAQETFLVLARQGGDFQGRSSIYTWLYGILLNLDRRERRRYGMRRKKLRVLWDNQPADIGTTPGADAAAEVAEWKRSLWARVAKLPDGQRQALVLRFSEALRYEEIAEVLQCPLGTVKSRIFHGLAGLRRMLDEEGAEARRPPAHPGEDLSHAV